MAEKAELPVALCSVPMLEYSQDRYKRLSFSIYSEVSVCSSRDDVALCSEDEEGTYELEVEACRVEESETLKILKKRDIYNLKN